MVRARRAICGLVVFMMLAVSLTFAALGRRGDYQSSENGSFDNCGTGNTCAFLGSKGIVTLTGSDASGNPVTVTIGLYDWGFYPCGDTTCTPTVNAVVLDTTLNGTDSVGIGSVVVKGNLPNPGYVTCGGGGFIGIGCVLSPAPDANSDVQEPTPISAADQGIYVNTRWDFGGVPPQSPPPPAVPFDELQCESDGSGFDNICDTTPLGEAVLAATGSVAQNKLTTSPSNYLVTLTDGTKLGGLVIPASPSKQAGNNTESTEKVITGTGYKAYIDTSKAYPAMDTNGNMSYPQGFALAPLPPVSSSSFPSCYPANESRVFRTVWYSYTAPGNGSVTINTAASRYDTLLYVFPKNNPTSPTACDDEAAGGKQQAAVTFTATTGTQYEIVVYEVPPFAGTDQSGNPYAYPLSVDGALHFSLKFATTASTTTTKLTSSPNPSVSGQGVVFTATVTPKFPGSPAGTVTFKEGTTVLGTSSLNESSQATYIAKSLSVGSHLITAVYSGDFNFLGSSGSDTQRVYAGATTTTITSDLNPIALGQPVTFTASITTQPSGKATGTVKFKDGTTVLGSVSVSNNTASFTTSSLGVGTHSIYASYSGNSFYEPSVSYGLLQNVKAASSTTVISSQNPSQNGTPVTLTVTVTSSVEIPTGLVSLTDGNQQLVGNLPLTSGSAQFTTSWLPVGTGQVTAVYSGNADLFGSTSPPLNQVANFPANFHVLYDFSGGTDGAFPKAGLSNDSSGNLYGTTYSGGNLNCSFGFGGGCGTVFKLDTSDKLTVLHPFTGEADGAFPYARPLLDKSNNLYGTTNQGGIVPCPIQYSGRNGCGTVFKVDAAGNESVLYSFTGSAGDGAYPVEGLATDSQGNLYGSTEYGGTYGCCYGTVFKLSPAGQEIWRYSFTGGADGAGPSGVTRPDSQGNVYGTARTTGAGNVFKIDPNGNESTLYSFTSPGDGNSPEAALVRDSQGNLYGTTFFGGAYGYGTVFMLSPAGQETILYSFTGKADGSGPDARLERDSVSGDLYGTTSSEGTYRLGTAFKVTPSGQETTLYNFTGTGGDGSNPFGGLTLDSQGNLYGTTSNGGAHGYGMVFKITP